MPSEAFDLIVAEGMLQVSFLLKNFDQCLAIHISSDVFLNLRAFSPFGFAVGKAQKLFSVL